MQTIGTDWPIENNTVSNTSAQKAAQIMSCAANTVFTTGYPAWTNYYAGYMFMVNNTTTCSIIVNCFEARFQGTSGYRIYTKTGTFIGFETLSGSWTLVGTAANVTGVSTITCSPIPITVNVTIPPLSSQSFYLTRTDNLVANRHLYITGAGTAGVTIYASDANVQITEAEYLDTYFVLQIGVRRPSFNMYYDKICGVLPIELTQFKVKTIGQNNILTWTTATELNNNRFEVERSEDALNWLTVGQVLGSGTSTHTNKYKFEDQTFKRVVNYYRLKQIDHNGVSKFYEPIVVDNAKDSVKVTNRLSLFGQNVDENYNGIVIEFYSDGTYNKVYR